MGGKVSGDIRSMIGKGRTAPVTMATTGRVMFADGLISVREQTDL